MSLVLGIDTGGTFTDAVVIDLETKKIHAETKSETTHFHLIEGISKAIEQLEFDRFDEISYASLSTTLATNAIVEGRGCRVGLILMGFTPEREFPQCELREVPGKVDLHGTVIEPLDLEKTKDAIESLRGKVDAVAVSGILSIRNPEHEETVKQMVREILDIPCIAAHELSSVLGMHERTVTVVLNARLLSVIDDLLHAVKTALAQKGMNVPVMVVKGDGSLMTEATAKYRPIETILSGPASSIIGATFLNGTEDGLILDMGGTTTDIAVMKNGRPRIDPRGARVGGWRTRVAAAEVNTFGLGGDSRIYMEMHDNRTKVGPRRVYPICTVAKDYPHYLDELYKISSLRVGMMRYELCEGFLLLRDTAPGLDLTVAQSKVMHMLKEGAHTIYEISKRLGIDADFVNMEILIEHGIVAMVGFTPTDILHATGEYVRNNAEASKVALSLIARRWDLTEEETLAAMRRKITERMAETILDSAFSYEKMPADAEETHQLKALVEKAFYNDNESLMSVLFRLNMPVIGIGAPIRSWLDPAAEKFYTDVVYPEHYNVANAVGAAAGKVMHIYNISVQNHEYDGIYVYMPWGRKAFGKEEDATHSADDVTFDQMHVGNHQKDNAYMVELAIEYAIRTGKERMVAEMEKEGIENFEILVERKDSRVSHCYNENIKMFIESNIEIVAVTNPAWEVEE